MAYNSSVKLFITGKPRTGKSSLLASVISEVVHPWGLITEEKLVNDQRVGFTAQAIGGSSVTLAQTNTETPFSVGKYYLNISNFDDVIDHLPKYSRESLLCIDEIGEMQLYSVKFRKLVIDCLASENDMIATLSAVYDHPLIRDIMADDNNVIITLDAENRGILRTCLAAILDHREAYSKLTASRQKKVVEFAKKYLASRSYFSLYKLFENAIQYTLERRVLEANKGFIVQGKHAEHVITRDNKSNLICDCPLSLGLRPYNQPEACSHIQAVELTIS